MMRRQAVTATYGRTGRNRGGEGVAILAMMFSFAVLLLAALQVSRALHGLDGPNLVRMALWATVILTVEFLAAELVRLALEGA